MFVRSITNYDFKEASLASGLSCPEQTRAHQEYKLECDINQIMKNFGHTGQLPSNIRMPTYGDFEQLDDYHQALNAIARANESFDQLPSDVRKRFNNDPGLFVDFCSDEKNRDEAKALGLVTKEQLKDLAGTATVATATQEPPKV